MLSQIQLADSGVQPLSLAQQQREVSEQPPQRVGRWALHRHQWRVKNNCPGPRLPACLANSLEASDSMLARGPQGAARSSNLLGPAQSWLCQTGLGSFRDATQPSGVARDVSQPLANPTARKLGRNFPRRRSGVARWAERLKIARNALSCQELPWLASQMDRGSPARQGVATWEWLAGGIFHPKRPVSEIQSCGLGR